MKCQILHKDTKAVIYEYDYPEVEEPAFGMEALTVAHAVEAGVDLSYAFLNNINFQGYNLANAKFSHADFFGSRLVEANLNGADFSFTNLQCTNLIAAKIANTNFYKADFINCEMFGTRGLPLPYDPDQVIPMLDSVREILLQDAGKLDMNHWHETQEWLEVEPDAMHTCNTTHCLAGWMQAITKDKGLRRLDPEMAGTLLAPQARALFYRNSKQVLDWLRDRVYVDYTPAQPTDEASNAFEI